MILLLLIPLQMFASNHSIDIKRWNALQSIEYSNSIRASDLELYLPADDLANLALQQQSAANTMEYDQEEHGDRNERVGKKIMDHTFRSFAKGRLTPNAKIFKTVENLEQSMKYDIDLGKSEDGETQHKLNLQYQPFQNVAKVRYRGFLQANLEYFFSESKVECSIQKEISTETLLALSHSNDSLSPDSKDSLSMLQLRWQWD